MLKHLKSIRPMTWFIVLFVSVNGLFFASVAYSMYRGPLNATLSSESPAPGALAGPRGENHPKVRTELAPFGFGTRVLVTYKVGTARGEPACMFHVRVLNGQMIQPDRSNIKCDRGNEAGEAQFEVLIPSGDYDKSPKLMVTLQTTGGDPTQIDSISLAH